MDDGKPRDAIDEMVDALSGIMSHEHAHGRVMDELGRTRKGELFILRFLLEKDAPVLPTEIAEALGSSTSRISAALGALEKKGFVTREIDRANRRNILVTITDGGRARISQIMAKLRENLRAMVIEMGLEDAREFLRLSKRFFEIAGRVMPEMGDCRAEDET